MEIDRSAIWIYTLECSEDKLEDINNILEYSSIQNPDHSYTILPEEVTLIHGEVRVIGVGTALSVDSTVRNLQYNGVPLNQRFKCKQFQNTFDA